MAEPKQKVHFTLGEVVILLAVLALATVESPLTVTSAKTPGAVGAFFEKITA